MLGFCFVELTLLSFTIRLKMQVSDLQLDML